MDKYDFTSHKYWKCDEHMSGRHESVDGRERREHCPHSKRVKLHKSEGGQDNEGERGESAREIELEIEWNTERTEGREKERSVEDAREGMWKMGPEMWSRRAPGGGMWANG